MTSTMFSTSTEYYRCKISATQDGAAFDPTSDAVYFLFAAANTAPAVDAVTKIMTGGIVGTWEATQPEAGDNVYYCRTLVSAGQLAAGNWWVLSQCAA